MISIGLQRLIILLLLFYYTAANSQFVTFESLTTGTDYATSLDSGDTLLIEQDILVTISDDPFTQFLATETVICDIPFNVEGNYMFMSGGLVFDPSARGTTNLMEFGYNYLCTPDQPFFLSFDGGPVFEVLPSDIELIVNNQYHLIQINGFISISGSFSMVRLLGTDLGVDELRFDNVPQECRLLNLETDVSTCSDLTFDLTVDVQHVGTSDSFNIEVVPSFMGTFAYADLPIVVSNLAGDGVTEYEVIITDPNDSFCTISTEIDPVLCGVDQCTIENIDLSFGECGDNIFPLEINFDYSNPVDIRFRVTSSQGDLGEYRYINLPITVDFPSSDNMADEYIAIADFEDANCNDTLFFGGRDCFVPPCTINTMDVFVQECAEDSIGLIVNFVGETLVGEFFLFVNGNDQGVYPYDDLPVIAGPFPADGVVPYVVYVEDRFSPACNASRSIGVLSCMDTVRCNIFNMSVSTSSCDNGLFSAEIDFNTSNVMDSFVLFGNQMIYGRYGFNQVPVVVPGLSGDGTTDYEFSVSAIGNTCTNSVRIGPLLCPSCVLEIDEITVGECNSDNSVELTIDLNYSTLSSDFIRISNPSGSLGLFVVENEPLTITYPLTSGDEYIIISDANNVNCTDSMALELPDCMEELCAFDDINILGTVCDGALYDAIINFSAANTSDSFRIRQGVLDFGIFAYTELPVRIGPFPGDNNTVIPVVIEDLVMLDCNTTLDIGPIECVISSVDDPLSTATRLYPSPAHDQITIALPNNTHTADVYIYAMDGSIVHRTIWSEPIQTIDVGAFPSGTYIIRAALPEGVVRKKFVVTR